MVQRVDFGANALDKSKHFESFQIIAVLKGKPQKFRLGNRT